MKVYSAPFPAPDFASDTWREDEGRYLDQLRDWCRAASKHKDAGVEVRFPAGDGYAVYMLLDHTRVIHVPVGDAWDIPAAHARGLRAKDIAKMVSAPSLFGGSR